MYLIDRDRELFFAINALKARSFIYNRGSESKYYTKLIANRNEVNEILANDNCEMRVMHDLEVCKIHFRELDSDCDEQNMLKASFTASEMKVYVACLTIYTEKYASRGAYIDTHLDEVMSYLEDLHLQVGTGRSGGSSRTAVSECLKRLDRFGMLEFKLTDKSILLKPGITMAIDRETFLSTYNELLRSFRNEEDNKEDES